MWRNGCQWYLLYYGQLSVWYNKTIERDITVLGQGQEFQEAYLKKHQQGHEHTERMRQTWSLLLTTSTITTTPLPHKPISTLGFVSWSSCCNQDQSCSSPAPLWPQREMCLLKSTKWLYTFKYHQKPQALLCLLLGSWILVWTLSSYNPHCLSLATLLLFL